VASNYDAKGGSFCPIGWWNSGIPSQSDHIKIGGCDEKTQGSGDRGRRFIEVGIAETNEEAWLRHLTTHPGDLYANVRIFNRQKKCQNLEASKLKP
jgi:hypothetical protein